MQVFFRQLCCPVPRPLAASTLPNKPIRYLPDSLYFSITLAAGLLWLALSVF
jgi:hypothetical protein